MMFKDPALESDARRAVSLDEAEKLLTRFATLTRESGTPDEHTAGEYIAGRLRALGVPVTVHQPDLFLSIPERSEVRLKPDTTGADRLKLDTTGAGRRKPDAAENGEELIR